jgi:hypothetical protein
MTEETHKKKEKIIFHQNASLAAVSVAPIYKIWFEKALKIFEVKSFLI